MTHNYISYKGTNIYDLFHLTVSILNLEEKLEDKLAHIHPFKRKKMELMNELSMCGLNHSDFIDINKEAKKYIELHK